MRAGRARRPGRKGGHETTAMTEIERRLRAAMHAAVDDEQPPANLLGSVRTPHRRPRTRTAGAGLAMRAARRGGPPPAPPAGHFRFLFGPNDFTLGVDGRYTLRDGENGVTFAGCPPHGASSLSYVPGYTEFGGRYLIDKIPRRVSLDVWTSASRQPTRITFLVGY